MNFLNQKAQRLRQGAIRQMFDKASLLSDVISLGIGEPDMPTPREICGAGIDALAKGDTHYTPNAGFSDLRKAIGSYLKTLDITYDFNKEIIVTNGGMGALSLCLQVILDPCDEVLIQDPMWLNYVPQIEYADGKAVCVPVYEENDFVLRPEDIENRISDRTKAIIINYPNNPTGAVASANQLEAIAEMVRKHDLLLISDEVYNTLVYDGATARSIASFRSMKERSIVVNSFSKSFAMTGWRVGYAAGPEKIIDKMIKLQENFNACASSVGQRAASFALLHPDLCEEMRKIYQARRDVITNGLNSIPGIKCLVPKGTFYVFPSIRSFNMSSQEFCNLLLEQEHVVCIPGSAFGNCGEGYIRISYANSIENLEKAIKRIEHFISGF